MLGAKSDGGWAVSSLDQGFELPFAMEGVDAELPPFLIKRLNGLVDFSAGDRIGEIAIAGAGMGEAGAGAGGGDHIELAGGGCTTRDWHGYRLSTGRAGGPQP